MRLVLLAALVGSAACVEAPAERDLMHAPVPVAAPGPEGLRLFVLDGGSSLLDDMGAFGPAYEGRGPIELPVLGFLVVHPRGTLLWDTGHDDALRAVEPRHLGGYGVSVTRGVEAQLEELGLAPRAIDLLAFSHWHWDHTGNANLFGAVRNGHHGGGPTVIGQRDEYELAFRPEAARTFGMRPETYVELSGNPVDLFHGDRDVFGDGSVRILRVGGHTVGSQVLLVELPRYGPVLLSGDLYHFAEQRRYRRVPPFNHDRRETLAGMDRVETLLRERPEVELWITHDPAQMGALSLAPTFYE
ncbi:MAG: N-acyl homoserine lactonase family protein [Planctomycetota bacterium]